MFKSKFIHLKIRRRDGVESLTTLEESELKVPIDGCIRKSFEKEQNPVAKFGQQYTTKWSDFLKY